MWNTVQCAVQGRSHLKADIPCQDKTNIYTTEDITVVALADGAGSASCSHFGAERITRFICKYFAEDFSSYFEEKDGAAFKRKVINDIDTELNKLAEEIGCTVKDLASTLLVAGVCGDRYILIHIGDGVIGYLKEDQLHIASQPENGEFVNTTVFTTSKDALQTMKVLKGYLGTIEGFVLMSDGTEASLYNKRERSLVPVLKKIMRLTQILDQECLELLLKESFENVIKQSTVDDCSIAILMKEKEDFYGYRNLNPFDKKRLLGIDGKAGSKKRLKKYDILLERMQKPCSILTVGKAIHLKPKYAKKYLNNLLVRNIVVRQNGRYRTAVIMQKQS